MTTQSLDELEGALDRVARRLSESSSPVPGAAQRVAWLEREPWLGLAWTGSLITLAVATGRYGMAGALMILTLPAKAARVRLRRDELGRLNSVGDLLALEVQSLQDRHSRLGTSAAVALWLGSLFAVVGLFSPRPLVGLGAGALALFGALYLLLGVRPRLRRALADLGAKAENSWLSGHLAVLFFLFFPVLMLVGLVRSLLGWDKDDEADDSAEHAGAAKSADVQPLPGADGVQASRGSGEGADRDAGPINGNINPAEKRKPGQDTGAPGEDVR
jgi:hypothetical protein